MERKIGEIFTYEDKTYKVVKVKIGIGCIGCAFKTSGCSKYKSFLGHCFHVFRRDNTGVIFELINNNNMEIKNNQLTIEIPEGMKIDTENSDLTKGIIKFKTKTLDYKTIYCKICNKSLVIDSHKEDENRLRAISKLMNIARYYNKDWKPDWNNSREGKWYIYYDHTSRKYIVSSHTNYNEGDIYFKNSEDAKAVRDNLNFRNILDAIYKN